MMCGPLEHVLFLLVLGTEYCDCFIETSAFEEKADPNVFKNIFA